MLSESKELTMLKKIAYIILISSALLLSACSVPVIQMQHFSKPQAKLPSFGNIEVQTFSDKRNTDGQILYQETLKSDNMTSEFLQKSQGLGSGTWHYATEPQLNVFLQKVMQQVGEQSGFINPHSSKHYTIEGNILGLGIQMNQSLGEVTVRVKFTGVLRKDNGVMLMIMPIDFKYTQAMTQPLADKSQPAQLTVLLDQALTGASLEMYQAINANFPPAQKKIPPSLPLNKEGTEPSSALAKEGSPTLDSAASSQGKNNSPLLQRGAGGDLTKGSSS
ncbi:MAG: hypothetical protein K0R66_853 [Gammaproteobacteria bacterium]|jgi:hypothetical protein|nr:hypothetical protein [Gammaproteobacteria bacterium]